MQDLNLFLTVATILRDPEKLEINIDELIERAEKLKTEKDLVKTKS